MTNDANMAAQWITPEVKAVLDDGVVATVNAVQTVVYNNIAPANASGQLAQSISWIETNTGAAIVATGPAAKYVGTLRYGRKAGKLPPVRAIRDWMDVKGIATNEEPKVRDRIAWAIAIKMKNEGNYVLRNNMTPTVIWDGVITELSQGLADAVASGIVRILAHSNQRR